MVGLPDRRQRCAMTSVVRSHIRALERVLDGRFGLRIEVAGRLVEQQDRRVLEQGARDRDTLLLSAGQAHAALAEVRVVAVRLRGEELVGLGRTCGGNDTGLVGMDATEADV